MDPDWRRFIGSVTEMEHLFWIEIQAMHIYGVLLVGPLQITSPTIINFAGLSNLVQHQILMLFIQKELNIG